MGSKLRAAWVATALPRVRFDRFALADAGDSLEDANFAVDSATQAIHTLTIQAVSLTVPSPKITNILGLVFRSTVL